MRIAYVISNIDRWIAFEWIEEYFRSTDIQIDFYLLSSEKGYFYEYLKQNNQYVQWLKLSGKTNYMIIIPALSRWFISKRYHAIHCHFLDATICGLIAGIFSGIKKRIYTRHHSTFHHDYARKGVLIDRFCNMVSTQIIAISAVVMRILIEKEAVKPYKIKLIHHGFKWNKILQVSKERVEAIKYKYDLLGYQIIGVVSRHIEWKGIQYIIPAFKKALQLNPNIVLVLVNARGSYNSEIIELLKKIPKRNYRLIPFEKDIYALFHCFDSFIHVPINAEIEAFGQIYIEALALGIPSIMTRSGIGNEILEDHQNCTIVPFMDSEAIFHALQELVENKGLAERYKIEGPKSIMRNYSFEIMADKIKYCYTSN